jgi:F-type H+-transporting ATPase subunit gamma
MQNIIDIKNRSDSIKETAQITKAMEMISTSKLRKANIKFLSNAAYFNKVRATIKDILHHTAGNIAHPYLCDRQGERTAYIIIASDKGLAGDYNQKVLKHAYEEISAQSERYLFVIGHMAKAFFQARGMSPDIEYLHAAQTPTLDDARGITNDLLEMYDNQLIDSIKIIYTKMVSATVQQPVTMRLLPLVPEDFTDIASEPSYNAILYFEPSPKKVFDILVPQYIIGIVYSCLIQSIYSEHYERIRTMHNATQNAYELIEKLDLEYNRVRQEMVTTEIAEISSSSLFKRE